MTKLLYIIFCLIILISCDTTSYQVESRFNNGNYKIIYKKLNDTIINGLPFEQKFKVKFFENGDTLRKGKYVNDMAIDEHMFYENNKIICERNYVMFDNWTLDLINHIDTLNLKKYGIRKDSTYLNEVRYYDNENKLIPSKSHFYTADLNKEKYIVGDSVISNFKFYYTNLKVVRTDLYYKVPTDTSMVTMSLNNFKDNHRYSNKIETSDFNKIQGLVDIYAYDESMSKEDAKAYSKRLMLIEKEFVVEK